MPKVKEKAIESHPHPKEKVDQIEIENKELYNDELNDSNFVEVENGTYNGIDNGIENGTQNGKVKQKPKGRGKARTVKETEEKKKYLHVPRACSNCQKGHVACDTIRPCGRCVKMGKSDTCVDVEQRKRGWRKGRSRLQKNVENGEKKSTTSFQELNSPTKSDEVTLVQNFHHYSYPSVVNCNPLDSSLQSYQLTYQSFPQYSNDIQNDQNHHDILDPLHSLTNINFNFSMTQHHNHIQQQQQHQLQHHHHQNHHHQQQHIQQQHHPSHIQQLTQHQHQQHLLQNHYLPQHQFFSQNPLPLLQPSNTNFSQIPYPTQNLNFSLLQQHQQQPPPSISSLPFQFVLSTGGVIEKLSESFLQATGFDKDEIVQHDFFSFLHERDYDIIHRTLNLVLEYPKRIEFTTVFRFRTKVDFTWIEAVGQVETTGSNQPIAIRMKGDTLLEKSLGFQNPPSFSFTIHLDTKCQNVSGDYQTLLGYEKREITGRPLLELVWPEDESLVAFSLHSLFRGEGNETQLRFRLKSKPFNYLWFQVGFKSERNLQTGAVECFCDFALVGPFESTKSMLMKNVFLLSNNPY